MKVENFWDGLCVGVKGQSNSVIAGSPRKIFRYCLEQLNFEGRALKSLGALTGYQILSNSECH